MNDEFLEDSLEESKACLFDDRLESYQSFFDHVWAKKVMDLTSHTKISSPVFDLCTMWRAAANTHVVPWLMMQQFRAFADGLMKAHEPFGKKLLAVMRDKLVSEMGSKLNNMGRKRLQQSLDQIDNKVRAALDENDEVIDVDDLWQKSLANHEMRFTLWGSQRLCYAAVYYAYEDFLTRCVGIVTSRPDYRMPRRAEFAKDFGEAFGQPTREFCWNDPSVNAARLVRHALVHNGGRIGKELSKIKHGLTVVREELQIMAPDTSSLFGLLKDRTTFLIETIVGQGL